MSGPRDLLPEGIVNGLGNLLRKIYRPAESFRGRIAQSSFWGFALQISNQGLTILRTIVLAWLLAPEDFGLYALAMILTDIVVLSTYPGVEEGLLQDPDLHDETLHAGWTIRIVRGGLIASLLFVAAPYGGAFFDEPDVVPLIRVLGAAVFISMLRNPAEIYFKKDLNYQIQYLYKMSARTVSFVVMVIGAVYLRSAWALIYGFVVEKVVFVGMSYTLHEFRPRLSFDRSEILQLLDFGKWITGFSIVHYLHTRGDDFFVGKLLGSEPLGFYRIAFRVSQVVPMGVTRVISNVFFPVFSKIQDQPDKLREGFYKTFSVTLALVLPAGVGLYALIPVFTHLFLGPRWLPIVTPARIMTVSGMLRAVGRLWFPLYYALGEPRFNFYKNLTRVVAMFLPMYPLAVRFGLNGVCLAVLIGVGSSLGIDLLITSTNWLLKLRIRTLLVKLAPTVFSTGLMGLVLWMLLAAGSVGYVGFFTAIVLGAAVHLLSLGVFHVLTGHSPYGDLAFFC